MKTIKIRWVETDMGEFPAVSCKLSLYASPQEINDLVAELKGVYRSLGRKIKEAKKKLPQNLLRQPNETEEQYVSRLIRMSYGERELVEEEVELPRAARKGINKILAIINKGEVPIYYSQHCFDLKRFLAPLLEKLLEQYEIADELVIKARSEGRLPKDGELIIQ